MEEIQLREDVTESEIEKTSEETNPEKENDENGEN